MKQRTRKAGLLVPLLLAMLMVAVTIGSSPWYEVALYVGAFLVIVVAINLAIQPRVFADTFGKRRT